MEQVGQFGLRLLLDRRAALRSCAYIAAGPHLDPVQ